MAGITVAQAEAQLAIWLAANAAIASGQAYQIGARQLRRADLSDVLAQVKFWQGQVTELDAGAGATGIRLRGITPA